MELRDYIEILWRRKWVVIITLMITTAVTIVGTLLITPIYTTSSTLRVSINSNSVGYGDLLYVERLMNTFPSIVESGPILTELKQQLDIDTVPEINVEFSAESELMHIVVKDPDPKLAADSANILAQLFIDNLERTKTGRDFPVSIIDLASPPISPSSPRTIPTIILGVIIGLAGGLGLAFLFENLDTNLYSKEEIESVTGSEVLAQIPKVERGQPALFLNGNSPHADSFRRLQTNLFIADHEQSLHKLLVVSTNPGEGKSTIVTNLAQLIGQSEKTVALIDCDMRRPNLHKAFNLPNEVGLSNVLLGEVPLKSIIHQSKKKNVHVIPSGPLLQNPTDLLGSPAMSALLEELTDQYDKVLLDSPALLPVFDAAVIAPQVDGTLLIVKDGKVRREDLETILKQLTRSQVNLIGVAINQTKRSNRYEYYYQAEARQ